MKMVFVQRHLLLSSSVIRYITSKPTCKLIITTKLKQGLPAQKILYTVSGLENIAQKE